jgi:hypothetical protein
MIDRIRTRILAAAAGGVIGAFERVQVAATGVVFDRGAKL